MRNKQNKLRYLTELIKHNPRNDSNFISLQVYLAEIRNTQYYYAIKCLKKDALIKDDDVKCTFVERKVLILGSKHPFLCHMFCTFQTEVMREAKTKIKKEILKEPTNICFYIYYYITILFGCGQILELDDNVIVRVSN